MTNEIGKLKFENERLRKYIGTILRYSKLWKARIGPSTWSYDGFTSIEQTCKAALEVRPEPKAPLTYVSVAGVTYAGNIIDENPTPDFPDWVEIEVMDIDPTAGRMSITGPLSCKPPETVVTTY